MIFAWNRFLVRLRWKITSLSSILITIGQKLVTYAAPKSSTWRTTWQFTWGSRSSRVSTSLTRVFCRTRWNYFSCGHPIPSVIGATKHFSIKVENWITRGRDTQAKRLLFVILVVKALQPNHIWDSIKRVVHVDNANKCKLLKKSFFEY